MLSETGYFARRLIEETARARRSGTRFSVAVFTSLHADGELPELACVRGIPAILSGVRGTDTVCRLNRDSIAVLLIDADGEGSHRASLRLLERLATELDRWQVRILEYPDSPAILEQLGLAA